MAINDMKKILTINDVSQYKSGSFILNNKKQKNPYKNNENLLVTINDNLSIKDEVLNTIKSAENQIKICSFILDDDDVINSIEDVLKNRGVSVFILTCVMDKQIVTDFLSEPDMSYESADKHLKAIGRLLVLGAHIRASDACHAKFILQDSKKAIIMSANLTKRSLNENAESGVIVDDDKIVAQLEHVYETIYLYGTEYSFSIPDNELFVEKTDTAIMDDYFPDVKKTNLKWTYGENQHWLYKELINIIQNARKNLFISTFSIIGLDNLEEFMKALKGFTDKGGELIFFCRSQNHRLEQLFCCKAINELGGKIFGDISNHSKGIVNDLNDTMIFTANIDGEKGLINGFEVGLKFSEQQKSYSRALLSLIKWQIETSPYIYKSTATYRQIKDYYNYHYNQVDDDFTLDGSNIKYKKCENISLIANKSYKVYKDEIIIKDLLKEAPIYIRREEKGEDISEYFKIGDYECFVTRDEDHYSIEKVKKWHFNREKIENFLFFDNLTLYEV